MRTSCNPDLIDLVPRLARVIQVLQKKSHWYVSAYFERKSFQTTLLNLKQKSSMDHKNFGVVLRIYNGYTLYEAATNDLAKDSLEEFAQSFAQRILETGTPKAVEQRLYTGLSWAERFKQTLDPEIKEQIPKNVQADTLVHFGLRVQHSLEAFDPFSYLQSKVDFFINQFTSASALNYLQAKLICGVEESIFVDPHVTLSQNLLRNSFILVALQDVHKVVFRAGGLGGLETIDATELQLIELAKDLMHLKNVQPFKPGPSRVVLGPNVTGVLAHEAFGHTQEGDTWARGRSKASILYEKAERVGNHHATIFNNPAIYENGVYSYAAWGSYFFDEEGVLAYEQKILDQGYLQKPMTNMTSAIRLNIPQTANGKRESFDHGVYTRQTNTYFSAGDKTKEELLDALGDGYLALHPAGGMEDPKGMNIQVGMSYLYEVKNGKCTGRIFKGPLGGDIQLTGYTPDILNAIIAKSKIEVDNPNPDTVRHPYNDIGGCGKYHKEAVQAGCGGPYMLLDKVILG